MRRDTTIASKQMILPLFKMICTNNIVAQANKDGLYLKENRVKVHL